MTCNFGIVDVGSSETWVPTTEWMQEQSERFLKHGSNNRISCARIEWNRPNRLVLPQ